MTQQETTRLLIRELEELREKDRLREERLIQFLNKVTEFLDGFERLQRERDGVWERNWRLLDSYRTDLRKFEQRLSGLVHSLPRR
ncbi:MAG: hypothetical protein OXF74_04235 [Rhodobacteraceae bacterium]|nr:hypothetical protein [Paracoccaceae bacterium]